MKKIFIIEDDLHIGSILEEVLRKEGYIVTRAYSGTEALLALGKTSFDLVLLDLMLPGLHGEEILPYLKGIPVIILSAKVDVDHKVELLLSGAADYVSKPFHLNELLARIEVQLRGSSQNNVVTTLHFQDITLDPNTHVVSIDHSIVSLTRTEYAILKTLMLHPNQVISKSQLLDHISQDTPDCSESSLKIHVSNLRKKLREVHHKEYIESVWGIGFKLIKE